MAEAQTIQVEGDVTGPDAPIPEVQEDRPEWLPEKFKSPEDLANAYGELEKQFTRDRQEASENVDSESAEASETGDTDAPEAEAGEVVPLDYEALTKEFVDTGELSEDTYSDLESRGMPKTMVDAFIEGRRAVAQAYQQEVYAYAGGPERYTAVSEWAQENLPQDQIDAYNESLISGDMTKAKMAMDGLLGRYQSERGVAPSLVGGRASASVDTYATWAQVTKDMSTQDYQKDPAFRDAVQRKLERSTPK